LRSSIGSTPVQLAGFSTSPAGFQGSSVGSYFQQGFSNFEARPARQPDSPFQGFGGGPASGFSLFSSQPPSFGGDFQPIAQGGSTDPFISQDDFIRVQEPKEHIHQSQKRLEIRKGRVVSVEIPSGFSSGLSTSSTVGKKSPKAKTPVATTIANLEKTIARLERLNPAEESLSRLDLQVAIAKLEKMRNSM
jgi:hypothetical protein